MNFPPPVPLDYRKETFTPAPEGPIQNIHLVPLPWWQNRRYWAVGGLSVVALTGLCPSPGGPCGHRGHLPERHPRPQL